MEKQLTQQTSTKVKLWSRPFIFLLFANALVFLAFEMLAPTLPLYVSSLGGEATQIGLVTGIFVVSAIIIRPFTGVLATKMDKKYLLIIGIAIAGLATGGYYMVESIWALVLIRIIHGFGFGIMTTYFTTLAAEFIPQKRLGEGIGYFGAGETFMVSLGPLAGVFMLQLYDFKGLFMSSMAFMILTLLIMLVTPRNKSAKPIHDEPANKIQFKLIEKRVLFQSLLITLVGIGTGSIMSFAALFAEERTFSQIGLFFTVVAVSGLFVRLISGRIYDRFGPYAVLLPFGLLTMIGLIIIVMSQNDVHFLIGGFVYGFGFGAIFPAIQTWCLSLVGHDEHEGAVASFFNFFDIGVGFGAMALGIVAQAFDTYVSVFYVAIGAYILFMCLSAIYGAKHKRLAN